MSGAADRGSEMHMHARAHDHHDHHDHHAHTDPAELEDLASYRRRVLSAIRPLEPISVGLGEAHGAVLARDVVSDANVPGFANSAVDGYAVSLQSFTAGTPLTVTGEVAAGRYGEVVVEAGTAVRIMTGAPVPSRADAVVPVELVDEADGTVTSRVVPAPGENIRPAGESVRSGDLVLGAGRVLDAAAIGILAAIGHATVHVHPQPRVGVLSTGDELVEPDQPLRPGQIRDSNSWALAAAVREAGATPFRMSGLADDRQALREAIEEALLQVDLLLTTGGVSAGRYDFVKEVLADLGDVSFTKVGMKPGMPQAAGVIGTVPCFGFPGNPVSAMVSFEVFGRPAIRLLQGRRDLTRPRVVATMADPIRSPGAKVEFVRVRLERRNAAWLARSTGAQGSGVFRSLVEADGLAEIPPDVTDVAPGTSVTVHLLRDACADVTSTTAGNGAVS